MSFALGMQVSKHTKQYNCTSTYELTRPYLFYNYRHQFKYLVFFLFFFFIKQAFVSSTVHISNVANFRPCP